MKPEDLIGEWDAHQEQIKRDRPTHVPLPEVPLSEAPLKKLRVASSKEPARLPTKAELVALALDVYKLAIDNQHEWVDSFGNKRGKPKPEFKSAIEAVKVAAAICGHLGAQSSKAAQVKEVWKEEEELEEADAETALNRLRSKLAKELVK